MTISPLRAILLSPALVLAACGGDLTLPPEGSAAHIEVLPEGNNQSGRVGDSLPLPLVVRVTDSQDRPVAGTTVAFAIPDGAAAAEVTPSAVTDADGRASARLKLGTRTGPVLGRAEVPVDAGVTPVQASFNAMSLPANANGIAMVSGNDQSGAVGTQLPSPLVVVVTDGFGNPIPNITIEWSVTGGGNVSNATTLTGDNGQASVTRTLGPTAGPQTTLATATGLAGSPVTFNHIATAGSAARVIVIDGNGQSGPPGTKLDKDLVVQVLDAQDNPIAGRAVSWVVGVGGGSASPETSTTDANGRASTEWTLGPAPGSNTLTAVVSGVGNGAFNATGTKFESNTQITSHQPDPSVAGTPVTVSVNVTGSGGTPTGEVTVAGDGALAPCTFTLSNGSGSCQITLAQPGGSRDITATYAGDARYTGSSDTEDHRVEPAPTPNNSPTAAFTPPSCTTGQACQFADQSSDSDGSIASRLWQFQDGTPATSTDPNPSIIFASVGSKTVTLTVTDDDGATNSVTHQVTVTDPPVTNTAPTANNDTYATPGLGQPLTVPAPGVLANDTDLDGDPLSAQSASDPPQGSVSMNSDGGFTYTPDAGASGTDFFTYEASDGSATSLAIVEITITP